MASRKAVATVSTVSAITLLLLGASVADAKRARDANTTTTTTTLTEPALPSTDEAARAEGAIDSATTSTTIPFARDGVCNARFRLEDDGLAWVGLRFIAAYDRHRGSFAGRPDAVECSWLQSFDSQLVENYYGVLQVAVMNDVGFDVVQGPLDLLECSYEYEGAPPTSDAFLMQVQSAKTIVPIVSAEALPEVTVEVDCAPKQ